MKNNDLDEHSSKNQEYEELILFPFMYGVYVPQMSRKELIDFYVYVVKKNKLKPNTLELEETLRDLENYDVIQRYLNGEVTEEELKDPTSVADLESNSKPKKITEQEEKEISEIAMMLERRRKQPLIKKLLKVIRG